MDHRTRRVWVATLAGWLLFHGLVFAPPAPGEDKPANDPPADNPAAKLRTFYTGHSFHMFVPARVAALARAAGVEEYQTAGAQGIGGSRVQQHWDLPDERNKAKAALQSGEVDVFTMAPNVRMPDEGIDRFAELGLKHNPKLRLLVQCSWTPGDRLERRINNNALRDEADLDEVAADLKTWRTQIEAQVQAINDKLGRRAAFVVPAGDAVLALRRAVVDGRAPGIERQSDLFTDPIGHGKAPVQLLTAYCNFACITGRSPVGLMLPDAGVDAKLNQLLQEIAWETVRKYPFSGVEQAD